MIEMMHIYLQNRVIAITWKGADAAGREADKRNKGLTFKICAWFTDIISKINNTQVDYERDLDVVTSMYNLIECSNNYSKTSGNLC